MAQYNLGCTSTRRQGEVFVFDLPDASISICGSVTGRFIVHYHLKLLYWAGGLYSNNKY